jgi:hypothetical protein
MKVKGIFSDLPASSFAETDFSGKYLILFKHGIFRTDALKCTLKSLFIRLFNDAISTVTIIFLVK